MFVSDAELLKAYLADRQEPCPLCGYELRALTGSTCPECGSTLRLRVGLEHPRLAAYITGMAGLATAAGANVLLLLLFIAAVLHWGSPGSEMGEIVLTLAIGSMISALLLGAWIRMGRRIRQLRDQPLIRLAAVCWVLPLANLVIWIIQLLSW